MTNEDEPLVLELSPTVNDVDLDLIEIKLPLLNPTWVNESKICNICGKTVKTEKGLKRHLKIHNLNTHQVFFQRKQRVNKATQINDDICEQLCDVEYQLWYDIHMLMHTYV